jgi:hypothetical protein
MPAGTILAAPLHRFHSYMTDRTAFRRIVRLIAIAFAPAAYAVSVVLFATNVPVRDDYVLLMFVNEFQAASGLEKLRLVFSLHNEHRIAVTRLISLIVQWISGSLDFRALLLVGNAALVLAVVQLGLLLDLGRDWLRWSLLLLICLQPQPEKLMFYPMANVGAYIGLLMAVLYMRWLLEARHFGLVILAYLIAVFSTGAGAFLVLIGIPILLWRRQWIALGVHLVVSCLVFYFYFASASPAGGAHAIAQPLDAVSFFLQLLGGITSPASPSGLFPVLPLVSGAILLAALLAYVYAAISRSRTGITAVKLIVVLCYCLLMIALIVVARVSVYEGRIAEVAIDGRYRIYGILISAVLVVSTVDKIVSSPAWRTCIRAGAVLGALVFNVAWFTARLPSMNADAKQRVEGMRLYVLRHDPSGVITGAIDREQALVNLDLALKNGLYKGP